MSDTSTQEDWTKPAAMAIPKGGFFDKVEQGLFRKLGIQSAFEALEGWPADYATNPSAIVKFFREHQCPSFLEYSEHPYVSCAEIKKALQGPRRHCRMRSTQMQ